MKKKLAAYLCQYERKLQLSVVVQMKFKHNYYNNNNNSKNNNNNLKQVSHLQQLHSDLEYRKFPIVLNYYNW